MDMKALLEKMTKFAGEPEQKPGDQVRGTEKAKATKSGKDHPFKGRLVGGESTSPEGNMLSELSQEAQDKSVEWDLAEAWEQFKEEAFKDTAEKRPARKGSREEKYGKRGHKEQPRYKNIKESAGDEASIIVDEVVGLIGEGHTEVSPDVITTKVSAALGRPFMLKDLVAANNASPELQHYIDSINPSKIKFSTDILTVKNQDPVKDKEKSEAGVANMAARAASRPRLGESVEQHRKVFKNKAGKSIGEIGIDPEASPGNGPWYVKHYATGYDVVGFDDAAEAKEELMYVEANPSAVGSDASSADMFGTPVDSSNMHGMNEGWGKGQDRVSLPDEPSTYWNGKGQLSKEYNELYAKLVPSMGPADTIEGEVLRAASKIVYRHYNDGDEFNQASFSQLEEFIGKVRSYDDLAHKATVFALAAEGEYHPNTGWDSLDVMEYGPEDYDDDDYDEDDSTWYEEPEWDQDEDELDESAELNEGIGIGDIIKFKQPFEHKGQEFMYGQVTGFGLDPNKLGQGAGYGPTTATPYAGAKVRTLGVNLKRTPYHAHDDYYGKVYVPLGTFDGVDQHQEIQKFKELYGFPKPGQDIDYSKMLAEGFFGDLKKSVNTGYVKGLRKGLRDTINPEHHSEYDIDSVLTKDQAIEKLKAANANGHIVPKTEGWESGPEERAPRERDPDAEYDQARQEKLDAPYAQKEPVAKGYQVVDLTTKQPVVDTMFATKGEAMAYIMQHHSKNLAYRAINEGYTPLRDLEDYNAKKKALQDIQMDPSTSQDPLLSAELARRLDSLNQQYSSLKEMVGKIKESRGHKVLGTWFKNQELQDKFAKGEVTIPTPAERKEQERIAKAKSKKEQVKEYGATSTGSPTSTGPAPATGINPLDPEAVKKAMSATTQLKAVSGSPAPAPNLAKALDAASQGKPVDATNAKIMEPVMDIVKKATTDPKLANRFRDLAQQAKLTP